MNILIIEKIILTAALIIFSFQDIRKKEIYTYSVVIFYTAIAVLMIYKGFSGISIDYISMLLGISIYALFLSMYYMIKRRKIKGIRVAMLPFITLANCILWFCV